jgi:hypothetical protein
MLDDSIVPTRVLNIEGMALTKTLHWTGKIIGTADKTRRKSVFLL